MQILYVFSALVFCVLSVPADAMIFIGIQNKRTNNKYISDEFIRPESVTANKRSAPYAKQVDSGMWNVSSNGDSQKAVRLFSLVQSPEFEEMRQIRDSKCMRNEMIRIMELDELSSSYYLSSFDVEAVWVDSTEAYQEDEAFDEADYLFDKQVQINVTIGFFHKESESNRSERFSCMTKVGHKNARTGRRVKA